MARPEQVTHQNWIEQKKDGVKDAIRVFISALLRKRDIRKP